MTPTGLRHYDEVFALAWGDFAGRSLGRGISQCHDMEGCGGFDCESKGVHYEALHTGFVGNCFDPAMVLVVGSMQLAYSRLCEHRRHWRSHCQ